MRIELEVNADTAMEQEVFCRFHFSENTTEDFLQVSSALQKEIQAVAWVEELENGQAAVILSLGAGPDRLMEFYTKQGLLLECYMADVLADEILMSVYYRLEDILAQQNRYVKHCLFPGNELPLEQVETILSAVQPESVCCNTAYHMIPGKSIAYIAQTSKDPDVKCPRLCESCSNVSCSNRHPGPREVIRHREEKPLGNRRLLYGYGHIFSKEN